MIGESAGGHLSALLALTRRSLQDPNCIRGFIGLGAVYNLQQLAEYPLIGIFLKNLVFRNVNLIEASPLYHVSNNAPPFLMLNGRSDWHGFQLQSEEMMKKFNECGVKSYHEMVDGHHFTIMRGFGDTNSELSRRVLKFLLNEIKL